MQSVLTMIFIALFMFQVQDSVSVARIQNKIETLKQEQRGLAEKYQRALMLESGRYDGAIGILEELLLEIRPDTTKADSSAVE